MNGYELSRAFCNWAFENPEKIKPIHYAIYFFTIEHCNRLGWKEKFGLPSQMVMEAIGVKNWRTYSEGLNELISFGFLEMIETSKNQYSSNIVAIVNFTKASAEASTKALDKALSKHSTKQCQSTVSIDKQLTIEQLNKEQYIKPKFDFKKSLIDLGVDEIAIDTFLQVRKKKKAINSELAFNRIVSEITKSGLTPNQAITIAAEKSWSGFEASWIKKDNQTQPQQPQIKLPEF